MPDERVGPVQTLKRNVPGGFGRLRTTTSLPLDLRICRWPTTAGDEGHRTSCGLFADQDLVSWSKELLRPSPAPRGCQPRRPPEAPSGPSGIDRPPHPSDEPTGCGSAHAMHGWRSLTVRATATPRPDVPAPSPSSAPRPLLGQAPGRVAVWTRSFGVQTAIDAAATSGEEGLRSTLIKSMTVPAGDDAVLLPAGHYTVSLKLCRPPRGGQCVVARQPIAPHL
jgi:hypothetical protein